MDPANTLNAESKEMLEVQTTELEETAKRVKTTEPEETTEL